MAGFEKSEDEDPCHQWKGTYNLFAQIITCFSSGSVFQCCRLEKDLSQISCRIYRKKSIVSKMIKYTNQAICRLWRIMRFFSSTVLIRELNVIMPLPPVRCTSA